MGKIDLKEYLERLEEPEDREAVANRDYQRELFLEYVVRDSNFPKRRAELLRDFKAGQELTGPKGLRRILLQIGPDALFVGGVSGQGCNQPPGLIQRHFVKFLLGGAPANTYNELSEWLKGEGYSISKSAIGRYAVRTREAAQRVAETLQRTQAIAQAVEAHPDLD